MSDEGMVTMDEDEEIGQVSFVDYICVLCFSLPFDRRDGGEMMIITSYRLHSSSSSLVVSTARCCANCQITRNSSFVHVCEKRERERDVFSRSLSSKERTTINPTSEDGSLSLNVSLCFSFLFFLSLSLSLSGERFTRWMIATTDLFLCVFFVIIKTGGRLDGHLGFFRGERFSSTAIGFVQRIHSTHDAGNRGRDVYF